MTYSQMLKNKIPFLVTLVCCVTVASLAAAVRASGSDAAREASADTVRPKQVIVLDAGHPAYRLTTTPFKYA